MRVNLSQHESHVTQTIKNQPTRLNSCSNHEVEKIQWKINKKNHKIDFYIYKLMLNDETKQ